jgi:hypothetical protein
MANGRHVHKRRRSVVLLVLVAAIVGIGLLSAGAAYAAMRYEHAHADRIMPGVTIEGVDVSGMARDEAIEAVRAAAHAELTRPLTVTVGHDHWTVSPATLGQRAAVSHAPGRTSARWTARGTGSVATRSA